MNEDFSSLSEDYLDIHGIYDLFSSLLQQLLLNQPKNPYQYLISQLQEKSFKKNFY